MFFRFFYFTFFFNPVRLHILLTCTQTPPLPGQKLKQPCNRKVLTMMTACTYIVCITHSSPLHGFCVHPVVSTQLTTWYDFFFFFSFFFFFCIACMSYQQNGLAQGAKMWYIIAMSLTWFFLFFFLAVVSLDKYNKM